VDDAVDKRRAILEWYDAHGRSPPWRHRPGARGKADPYHIWISEIMLQQTTVVAVIPYFARFIAAFPTVQALAAADQGEVLKLWAGLGYYSRARNLHAAAKVLVEDKTYPQDEAGWRALPGIGAYTAAAISAIAFDQPANVVDGNVERVMARLHALATPLPSAKPELKRLAAALAGPERPGDYAQALMDLGATVCTPRNPKCGACPWAGWCAARAQGAVEHFPVKAPKPAKPKRHGVAFAFLHAGHILLVRRPPKGLLAAMPGLPTTPWREAPWTAAEARAHAPAKARWAKAGVVRHVFTHFELELEVWAAEGPKRDGAWAKLSVLDEAGLPTLFRKAATLAAAR
jgi:A/G-specific adenine glycosylase